MHYTYGRLSKEKGVLDLVEAFSKIKDNKLYIAGEGPEKENIEKYIKENGLEENIILLGFLNQEEVKEKIRNCTFTIVPSISLQSKRSTFSPFKICFSIISSQSSGFTIA